MKLTKVQREECVEAKRALISAFSWHGSDEGSDFWVDVYRKIDKYSKEPDKCKSCGKELD